MRKTLQSDSPTLSPSDLVERDEDGFEGKN